ncbi:MAG: hydrogenase small subunit [Candidatus Zixiibacteriota bacterium]|nr:MAG: hydrogenase small subunit [candidate division Zixibacteria bacterium]
MSLSRREFLELMGCTASVAVIPCILHSAGIPEPVKQALAEELQTSQLPVIWIQGQSCAGCSVSTLNTVHPDIAEVLTETISLQFHPNVMGGTGDVAVEVLERALTEQQGEFVLVVEGSISTSEGGAYCQSGESNHHPVTAQQWVQRLGEAAKAVVAIGTCASFGGIPAAKGNLTGARGVQDIIPKATIINIPGCPSHPDWVVGTIAHVILYGLPELDEHKRPKMFFGKVVHEQCERRADFEEGRVAEDFGQPGCLYDLGCKGPEAHCDACIRGWNNNVNWCIRSGSPCIGCTEPGFPDFSNTGLYSKLPIEKTYGIDWSGPHAPRKVTTG